jgi:hypothetical protein
MARGNFAVHWLSPVEVCLRGFASSRNAAQAGALPASANAEAEPRTINANARLTIVVAIVVAPCSHTRRELLYYRIEDRESPALAIAGRARRYTCAGALITAVEPRNRHLPRGPVAHRSNSNRSFLHISAPFLTGPS